MVRVERVITLNPNEVLIVRGGTPLFLFPEQEEEKKTILARATASISSNGNALRDSRGGRFEDLEHVRESLGKDFAYLSRRLAEFGVDRDELNATLAFAMSSANCTASEKRLTVDLWNKEFDRFLETLPQRNGNSHPRSA